MIIKQSEIFTKWLNKLKDKILIMIITRAIYKVKLNNFSNCKAIGEGIHEIKIDYQNISQILTGK